MIGASTSELYAFADHLTREGLEYRKEVFTLRAGGVSHWYLDARRPLCHGWACRFVGSLIVNHSMLTNKTFDVVASMGIGGIGPGGGVSHISRKPWAIGNEKDQPNDQTFYPKGVLGAEVKDNTVLVLDDTATTGDSIFELINLVREATGIVEDVYTVADRSNGLVAAKLAEAGYTFHAFFELDEANGLMVPVI